MPKDRLPWVLRVLQPRQSKTSRPCDAAVYQARLRLGWAPVRGLRKRVLGALADAQQDPTAFYHQRRLLGIDGTTLTVADTPQNERTFGKAKNQHRKSGYPLIRVVGRCELGTRALIDWVVWGQHRSENRRARRLLPRVPAGSLLLMDRNFHGYQLWQAAKNQGFDLLIRVQNGPTFPVEKGLDDGSDLSRVDPKGKKSTEKGIVVRVIHY